MADTEKAEETVAKKPAAAREESPGELLIRAAELLEKRRGKRAKSYAALAVEARAMAARLDAL